MWPRIAELLLATWLLASSFVFSAENFASDLLTALAIALFASLSWIEKGNKMHLAQVGPAAWLFYLAYTYPTHLLPFSYQNYILISLTLLTFTFIPSQAFAPPRRWRKFFLGQKIDN